MKYFVKIFVITYLIFGINNSFAEDKIVYVNMDSVLNDSKVGLFVQEILNKTHKRNLSTFKNTEEKLKKDEKDLLTKKNIMEKEEFDEKIKLLRSEAQQYQIDRRKKIEELNNIGKDARQQMLEALQPILAEYAEKNAISIIVDKKNIIVGKTNLDITKPVIEELNKKLPSIKLN